MPEMPKKVLLLGLPRAGHPFSEKLKNLVTPLMPAGDDTARAVYFHEDPTQIRLLFVASWMAARFAKVTQDLAVLYDRAMENDIAGDKAYFTNIDPSGEDGQRPPLLLPTWEGSRNAISAALWLGTRISTADQGEMLIQATEGRVVLLKTTKGILHQQEIGTSLDAVQNQSNIRTIARVCEAVGDAIAELSPEERGRLARLVQQEDTDQKANNGGASIEYGKWIKRRDTINEILNQ